VYLTQAMFNVETRTANVKLTIIVTISAGFARHLFGYATVTSPNCAYQPETLPCTGITKGLPCITGPAGGQSTVSSPHQRRPNSICATTRFDSQKSAANARLHIS
jgi:hypothetical protein